MRVGRARNLAQVAILAFFLYVGWRFYLFVAHFRRGTGYVPRPPAVEAFLPVSSLVALKGWLSTGTFTSVHPAGLAILVAALLTGVAFHRGFCSWLCPLGAVSEGLGRLGERAELSYTPRGYPDLAFRGVKYLLLAFFVKVVAIDMSGEAANAFLNTPYNKVADVKMLDFWLDPAPLTVGATAGIVAASVFVENAWCRYLCPYGALLGLLGVLSPFEVERDAGSCTDCGRCTEACTNHIDVASKEVVGSQECTRCFRCVDSCPEGSLSLTRLSPLGYGAALLLAFFLVLGVAKATGHWESSIPYDEWSRLIRRAHLFSH